MATMATRENVKIDGVTFEEINMKNGILIKFSAIDGNGKYSWWSDTKLIRYSDSMKTIEYDEGTKEHSVYPKVNDRNILVDDIAIFSLRNKVCQLKRLAVTAMNSQG